MCVHTRENTKGRDLRSQSAASDIVARSTAPATAVDVPGGWMWATAGTDGSVDATILKRLSVRQLLAREKREDKQAMTILHNRMGKWAAEWLISTPCTSHEPLYYPQPHLGGPSPIFEQFISASLVKLGVEDTLGSGPVGSTLPAFRWPGTMLLALWPSSEGGEFGRWRGSLSHLPESSVTFYFLGRKSM